MGILCENIGRRANREDGILFVAKVEDGFELLAENDMRERIIASPVPISNRLLIRGERHPPGDRPGPIASRFSNDQTNVADDTLLFLWHSQNVDTPHAQHGISRASGAVLSLQYHQTVARPLTQPKTIFVQCTAGNGRRAIVHQRDSRIGPYGRYVPCTGLALRVTRSWHYLLS